MCVRERDRGGGGSLAPPIAAASETEITNETRAGPNVVPMGRLVDAVVRLLLGQD